MINWINGVVGNIIAFLGLVILFFQYRKLKNEVKYNKTKIDSLKIEVKYFSSSDHNIYSSCTKHNLINSKKLSDSILCLPLYPDLENKDVEKIIDIIQS